ncbi:hypothetical protein BH11ARM2_BH11ARM2_13500 [soil metagenome]
MSIFRNSLARAVSVGTTAVRLDSGAARGAVMVASAGNDVFLKLGGLSAPTISATDYHRVVSGGDDALELPLAETIPVWAWAATSGTVAVVEVSE